MSAHILEAYDFRLEFAATIFDNDINSPVNTYLGVYVKNDDFCGSAVLEIDIRQLAEFSLKLKEVYNTLTGIAEIEEPYGHNGSISFSADKSGHIKVSGHICTEHIRTEIKKNELIFAASFDQTFLRPFADGLEREYSHYADQ